MPRRSRRRARAATGATPRRRAPPAATPAPPRPLRCAPAARQNTRASRPEHLGEWQEVNHPPNHEVAEALVEDGEPVGLDDRREDAGAVFRVFAGEDGAAL